MLSLAFYAPPFELQLGRSGRAERTSPWLGKLVLAIGRPCYWLPTIPAQGLRAMVQCSARANLQRDLTLDVIKIGSKFWERPDCDVYCLLR